MDLSILWVDDDFDRIDGLIRPLEQAGAKFTCVRTAASAIEVLEQQDFDLVLLDLIINTNAYDEYVDEAGMLVLKFVQDRKPQVPVIIVTILSEAEAREAALKYGCEISPLTVRRLLKKDNLIPKKLYQAVVESVGAGAV